METLAPRASYDRDELGVTARLPVVSGIIYGAATGGQAFAELRAYSLLFALAYGLIVALLMGAFFGFFFSKGVGWMARRVNDRLYAGDPTLVPAPPGGRYAYRLPCGWMRTPRRAIGGVLYIGQDGVRFDPLLNNRRRFREGWVIESLDGVSVERRAVPLPVWMRVWGVRSAPRVDISRGSVRFQLAIPDTAATFARLQSRIEELQGSAGRDSDAAQPS